ncbi:hypothetical protein ASC54_05460 [Yonghaparkia sp. Root332]|nr:hypothetical protein ASC54_05460 [Yonghaparkia sp. Root332]
MSAIPSKSVGAAYAFLLLLGGFAAHHFYLRRWAEAWILLALWWGGWLLTGIGVGFVMLFAVFVWWIYDLVALPNLVAQANRRAGIQPAYL